MIVDVSNEPQLYTLKEVANILRVSSGTIRRWSESGKLPYLKIEGSIRYRRDDIVAFINSGAAATPK